MSGTFALLGFLFSAPSRADVAPAPLFQPHAVLQCEQPLPVWGTAAPGESVHVSYRGDEASTTADARGHWSVTLPAQPADATDAVLEIRGRNHLRIHNVITGDVWLASGQSNMHWLLRNTEDAALEIPAARHPAVRHFKTERTVADAPAATVEGEWRETTPEHAAEFSAVAHHFALAVHQVTGRPIGIINSTWGGTPIESWLPNDTWSDPRFQVVPERWEERMQNYPNDLERWNKNYTAWEADRDHAAANGVAFNRRSPGKPQGPDSPRAPSVLHHGMIAPHLPAALRGVIWYQGEANASRADEYTALFATLITSWRRDFRSPDLPFYWVQLSSYLELAKPEADWAALRHAQDSVLSLPATGQAVSLDLGDGHNVHPRNKRDIGRRLARLALHRAYGLEVRDSGPVIRSIAQESNGAELRFDTPGKLVASAGVVRGIELEDTTGHWHPAPARIQGRDTVAVEIPFPGRAVAVRYAWANAPEASLRDDEGLPVPPFQRVFDPAAP